MSSNFGKNIKLSIFGQSHGKAVGVVIDGLPVGEKIDIDIINSFLLRRAPGGDEYSTSRREEDKVEIVSGLVNGTTCGAPLCAVIKNRDFNNDDYEDILDYIRPGHADFPAIIKYKNFNDKYGGGHFSGRLTAAICIAGSICLQILNRRGITIGAHVSSIMNEVDKSFDMVSVSAEDLKYVTTKKFPVIDDEIEERMKSEIISAQERGDSVGGCIECGAIGVPVGVGNPMFDGIENKIAQMIFAIPAVKGIEFGAGFDATRMFGSVNNDQYVINGSKIETKSNNCGGILGGISNGMPIIFKVAIKPTPSIGMCQQSINMKTNTEEVIKIAGRHDACIVPRAVPVVESAAAISILDLMLDK